MYTLLNIFKLLRRQHITAHTQKRQNKKNKGKEEHENKIETTKHKSLTNQCAIRVVFPEAEFFQFIFHLGADITDFIGLFNCLIIININK